MANNFASIWEDEYKAEVLIETGTGDGATLSATMGRWFDTVHTVELGDDKYLEAMAKYREDPVHIWHGDSQILLPHIINPHRSTTFWLDAHWSGGAYSQYRPKIECPLLVELLIITKAPWTKRCTILIDDLRLFVKNRPKNWPNIDILSWPVLDDILELLADWHPEVIPEKDYIRARSEPW